MKFKEIRPGMVIHCPKEEDAETLLEHLRDIGYTWAGGFTMPTGNEVKQFFFDEEDIETAYRTYQDGTGLCVAFDTVDAYISRGYSITKFSDLIEPDDSPINSPTDSPMTAVEVLRWFRHADGGTKLKLFETTTVADIFYFYTPEQIIDKITAYEADKKAPKPVEVEDGYFCELYEKIDLSDIAVLGYSMWGVDKNIAIKDVQEKARQYASKMKKTCYAKVTYKCRVKEDES